MDSASQLDPVLQERLYTFLVGREGKANTTVAYMLQRYRGMHEDGFSFEEFAKGPAQAQAEGDRFLVALRRKPAKGRQGGREATKNVKKCLLALARLHGYPKRMWPLLRTRPEDPQIYGLRELDSLLRLPFQRTERRRFWRALVMAHIALGWRVGELARLAEEDVDWPGHRVFMRYPEKGNPQRWFPVHEAFFSPNRAFGSWCRLRPRNPKDPGRIWTFHDMRGELKIATNHSLAKELSRAGRSVGVRANCQRGKPTCLTAHMVQGKNLAFVRHWAGHVGFNVLAHYLAFVDLGMATHLRHPGWFAQAPMRRRPKAP